MTKTRSIKNFIFVLMSKDDEWANIHLALIGPLLEKNDFFSLIEEFCNCIRIKYSHRTHSHSYSTFVTDGQSDGQSFQHQGNHQNHRGGYRGGRRGREGWRRPFYKDLTQSPRCLCGIVHWYRECCYVMLHRREQITTEQNSYEWPDVKTLIGPEIRGYFHQRNFTCYLNPSLRPANQISDNETSRMVNEALKNNETRAKMNNILKKK